MKKLYFLALLKLILIPALTGWVIYFYQLPPYVYCATVILTAAPTAGATAMLAQRFGRDAVTGAQAVSLVTLLSILTLPIFAAVTKALMGI